MMNPDGSPESTNDIDRRDFLSMVGKGLGLAALTSASVASLWQEVQASALRISHLSPEAAAADEDFWTTIQQSFTGNHAIVNLNNGGVCPSPKMVTEAFCRYTWQQEDVPAYTMWQILEPQSEAIRSGLAVQFGCDKEEIAITRNASESLETILFGLDLKPGDEVLTTTQDYPRMITTLKQRERRDGIILKQVKYPVPPKSMDDIVKAFESGITSRTKVILVSHVIFLTGQIIPVKAVCDLGRSKGIEVIVDGAHAFAHLPFTQKELGCDYYGASLHKWLYAPKGTGLLYVKKEKIETIWPLMAADQKQSADIRKFEEIGTHSAAMRLAIGEALLFHQGLGSERKAARLRYLRDYWANRLAEQSNVRFHTLLDPAHSCGITTVEILGVDPNAITSYLMNSHKIFTVGITTDEFRGNRITPNVYTTLAELDRFCNAMAHVARHGLPK